MVQGLRQMAAMAACVAALSGSGCGARGVRNPAAAPPVRPPLLKVVKTEVSRQPRELRLTVDVPAEDRMLTSDVPHVAPALFEQFPYLAHHKCENDFGYTFRKECESTEIPHLLEHLVIELQAQAAPHSKLKGETTWNWMKEPRGRFHVRLDYENERLAVESVRLGERLLVAIDEGRGDTLNRKEEIARLRRIARSGAAK